DHCGHMISHRRWQRLRYVGHELLWYFLGHVSRRDEAGHGGTLGIPTEHHSGIRTIRRRGLDVSAGVPNPVHEGSREIDTSVEVAARLIVDRIDAHRLAAHP